MELKITELLDEYEGEDIPLDWTVVPDMSRVKEATMKQIQEEKTVRPLRIVLVTAAVVAVLTGSAVAAVMYTKNADKMEENWNQLTSTEMTSEQKDFIDQRSADLGESVTDQGITITADSVTCTGNTVFLTYSIELDSEIYDLDDLASCAPDVEGVTYIENADYGKFNQSTCSGSGSFMENGKVVREERLEFSDLPDGTRINDGKTTLYMTFHDIWLGNQNGSDIPDVEGTWSFAIPLPEGEAIEAQTSDVTLEFDGQIPITVSDITVDESGCKFTVETEDETYIFANDGEMAMLAGAAEPDAPIYTVKAKLADGTAIPSTSASMNNDDGLDRWNIEFVAPLDPETVVALIFSDGTESIEISFEK